MHVGSAHIDYFDWGVCSEKIFRAQMPGLGILLESGENFNDT